MATSSQRPPYHTGKSYRCDLPLDHVRQALEANGFEVFTASDVPQAKELFFSLVEREHPTSISWGGSMTLEDTGLISDLQAQDKIPVIVTGGNTLTAKQKLEHRRQALTSWLFVTSANAITAQGQIVNLDGIGNRVAAMAFGPHVVVVIAGRNKIAPDLPAAMDRVKNYAAPMNIRRFLDIDTPCRKTGRCHDCDSQNRICNVWSITEKSRPKGRIKIILVDQELGY